MTVEMLTNNYPGFSKIEPYRGLSCVPGNLLAEFSGGDGAVSLTIDPLANILIDGYNLIGIAHDSLEKARNDIIAKLRAIQKLAIVHPRENV